MASPAEVAAALGAGARAGELLYSNPVKRRADVAAAHAQGVRLFVVDSIDETAKVADAAPGASVLARLSTTGVGPDWSLSGKFGCSTRDCVGVLLAAARMGLDPAGVAFHVGSQQRDPQAWTAPITAAATVFDALRESGSPPWLLDLGGGFPARYEGRQPPLACYGEAIEQALTDAFGARRPRTMIEPGRGIAGDAGILVTSVLSVVWRDGVRWVYLDAGVFSGLVETLDEAIRYRIVTSADGGPAGPVVLAGPTCDSVDVLYQRTPGAAAARPGRG